MHLLGKRKWIVTGLLAAFIAIELVLYFVIQTVSNKYFGIPTYISVLLAFCFSFVCYTAPRGERPYFVNIALLFTLGADFCLVVLTPAEELIGVSVFIGAQICYFLYIIVRERGALLYTHITLRVLVTALAALLPKLLLGDEVDALSTVSVVYYSVLALNLVFSLFHRDLRLFSLGLFLFALCDLSIGLENLSDYFSLGNNGFIQAVENTELNLAWIFYLPSQVMISASTVRWLALFRK